MTLALVEVVKSIRIAVVKTSNINISGFTPEIINGNVWIDTYILKHDYDISKMKFQEDEVSDAKWATWEEINELVKNGEFIKHRWEFVNKFLKDELEKAK